MRTSVLIVVMSLLSACVTVADRAPVAADLIANDRLTGRSDRPRVSLEILQRHSMKIQLQFDDTDNYKAIYDYNANIAEITRAALSRYYDVVDPEPGIPSVRLVFGKLEAHGTCSNSYGGLSTCTQSAAFQAVLSIAERSRKTEERKVQGRSSASEGGYLWLPASFDPLHRQAAKEAYSTFLRHLINAVDEDLAAFNTMALAQTKYPRV